MENMVRGMVERYLSGRFSEKHGMVTSYDPDKHLAKVMFQPEEQESGWIPIETSHVGNGFGMAVGLTPGDGKKTGDQVVIRYQEGDIDGGKVSRVVHSDDQKPPRVESGEMVMWTKFRKSGGGKDSADGGEGGDGQKIYFKKDGSITITDGNGGTLALDGKGNFNANCNNHSFEAKQDYNKTVGGKRALKVSGNDDVDIGGNLEKKVGGKRKDKVGGLWNAVASFGVWSWLQDDDG
jgi:uncharacterized protein involved in type VI secretion and phage assembly